MLDSVSLDRERVGDMLQSEDKYAVIRQLEIATAAHDLRNRLSIARCQLLQLRCRTRTSPNDATIRDSLASISRGLLRTNALLDAVLEMTADQVRLPATVEHATDLVSVARQVIVEELSAGRNSQVAVVTALPCLTGAWDAERLRVVLRVLLDNAIAYSPVGAGITVEITACDEWATIVVRDFGPGIPADEVQHVFEPFFRGRGAKSHGAGLGLGLPMARLLVEQYAGVLDVETVEGGGCSFRVRLPLTEN